MKKLCVMALVLAVAMMLASPAMATKSRLRAMGYVDNYIEDDYNIFMWYATLPSYANILAIELINDHYFHEWPPMEDEVPVAEDATGQYGSGVSASFSLIKGLGEDNEFGVLGLFFKEVTWGPNPVMQGFFDAATHFGDDIDIAGNWMDHDAFSDPLYNKFTLMYGYAMDGMSFGLYFSRADQNMKLEMSGEGISGEGENNWSYTTLGLGARFDIGESAYGDIAFDYNMASLDDDLTIFIDEAVNYTLQDDAGSKFDVRARVFYEWSEYLTIVPYFSFGWWDFAIKADDLSYYTADCFGNKGMMIDFGIGTDWMVNEENTIIFAIEPYKYMKIEPSDCVADGAPGLEGKMVTFPRFLLALESEVTDWMVLRTGCSKDLRKWEGKYEAAGEEYTGYFTEAPFYWFLGLGFDVSDFEFDCVVNEEVPFSMGYWLTGYQPNGDDGNRTPIWMISAKYHF